MSCSFPRGEEKEKGEDGGPALTSYTGLPLSIRKAATEAADSSSSSSSRGHPPIFVDLHGNSASSIASAIRDAFRDPFVVDFEVPTRTTADS